MKNIASLIGLVATAVLVALGGVTAFTRAKAKPAGAPHIVFEATSPPPSARPEPLFPGSPGP